MLETKRLPHLYSPRAPRTQHHRFSPRFTLLLTSYWRLKAGIEGLQHFADSIGLVKAGIEPQVIGVARKESTCIRS